MSLRNEDYTDRELLHVIATSLDERGMASSESVAARLGLSPNGDSRGPGAKIATRLSWMTRYGFLARIDPQTSGAKGTRWVITQAGEEIMNGRLSRTFESQLDRMNVGAQVLTMRALTVRGYIGGAREGANALRREYLHQVSKRPR